MLAPAALAALADVSGVALKDPILLQSILRSETLTRIPPKAALKEVNILRFCRAQYHLHILGARAARLPARIGYKAWVAVGIKEHLDPRRILEDTWRRDSADLHDARQLLHLILAGKKRIARVELG
jgi:hypothetical protein